MDQDTAPQESMTDLLNRLGVPVTEEGKARARRRLAEAQQRHADTAGERENGPSPNWVRAVLPSAHRSV